MTSSANNSTNTPLSGGSSWVGMYESPADTIQGVQILINTNVSGTAYIQFSQDKTRVEYEHAYGVIGGIPLFKVERRKAKFVRVKYINDASAQTLFLLHTTYLTDYEREDLPITIDAEDSNILMFGELPSGQLQAVKLDASGNIKVSGISGGGVSSDVNITNSLLNVSDASSHQLLSDLSDNITLNTDRLLYDLDIIANHGDDASANALTLINAVETQTVDLSNALSSVVNGLKDISGSVSISNQITGFATENTLNGLATTSEDISLKLTIPQRSWVEVDFDTQSSLLVQGPGTWRVPLTGEEGWEYLNSTIGGATAYFYSNTALVANGQESDITLGSLTTMWFVGNYRLATEVNPNRRFYLSVYTKPQGAGDYQPWYRSSKTWQLPNSAIVSKGADVFYYAGLDISTIYKEYDHTDYEPGINRGPCASDEVIQFMALAVDSACPSNEFDGIIKHAGFSTAGGTNRVVSFTSASREKIVEDNLKSLTVESGELKVKDASAVALLAEIANGITVQVGQVEISGVVVTDISGSTFTDDKLNVFDVSANSELTSIKQILGDTLLTVNYGLLNDTPQYAPVRVDASGSLFVKVNNQSFTDDNLNVYDASASSHLSVIEDILDNGYVSVYDASSEFFLTGIKTQTDKLSFQNEGTYETLRVRVENPTSSVIDISGVSLVDGKLPVYDASANEPLAKLSFYADGYGAYDLRTQITNSVGVSVNNQPTVSIAAASVIGIDTLANTVQLSSGTEVGIAYGSQVALASGSQVQLTNSEVGLINGSQIYANLRDNNGNAIGSTLTEVGERAVNSMAFAWDNANDTYERVRLGESGGLLVQTIGGVPLEVSGNITVADISVNVLNSSLDVRCYASTNGSSWHHLASDSNGQLNVHSKLQDGAGNDLTSTLDGTVRSLDVSVKNTSIPVSNTTATALYTRVDGSGVQIANNVASVTGPTQIGSSVDMDEYTWVGAMVNFGTVTTGGSVYMEFSPDNSTWGRSFDSAFPSMGTNITSFIRPSVPNTFRYVRLYADAPLSASNVSAWISMK